MSRHIMKDEHFARISTASSHQELFLVARDILNLLPDPLGMVCGPISTGGLGSLEANEVRFQEAITSLQILNINIFDQMPFEPPMKKLFVPGPDGYDWRILTDFYEPIFLSGRIKTKFFIPGWESSTGARWEREQADTLGIAVVYLDQNLLPIW